MSNITEQLGSSIDTLTREYEIITHNLANASTAGFKRRCNSFTKVLNAQLDNSQTDSTGTAELNTVFDFTQGNIVQTSRELDFALSGKGFFIIETPDGPLYTRNGSFSTNQNGQLVDMQGRIVAGKDGAITIPNNIPLSQLVVTDDGSINANGVSVGQFKLVDFGDNQNKLVPVGSNCYQITDSTVAAADASNVIVKQGYQEASNVQVVDELVDLVMVSRLYEANMQFLSTGKQISNSLMNVAMA
jgi:flagellar basal-body rod protein FlgF